MRCSCAAGSAKPVRTVGHTYDMESSKGGIARAVGGRLMSLINEAVEVQRPVAIAMAEKLRYRQRRQPGESGDSGPRMRTPAEVLAAADRTYLSTVAALGAAVGAAAAVPGVGQGAAVAGIGIDLVAGTEASVLLVLTYAAVHGVDLNDVERLKTLIFAILGGAGGINAVEKAAGPIGKGLGAKAVAKIPAKSLKALNARIGAQILTKYGTKRGVLALGKVIPFGIGAVVGSAMNLVFGAATVTACHQAFGPAPTEEQHLEYSK